MPIAIVAGLWAFLAASALLIGAAIGYLVRLPQKITAGVMALGCGVLISAVAYDLLQDGFEEGGIWPIVAGALAGSLIYTLADWLISIRGGNHRKRSNDMQISAAEGGAAAIAVGSVLDGVPESIVLGLGVLSGEGVSLAVLAAVFLSNLAEGLSSAAGMREAERGPRYVFGVWGGIVLLLAFTAVAGASLLGTAPPHVLATVNAVAAGALLTMVVNTMIPEAVAGDHQATGLLATIGLLIAFALTSVAG